MTVLLTQDNLAWHCCFRLFNSFFPIGIGNKTVAMETLSKWQYRIYFSMPKNRKSRFFIFDAGKNEENKCFVSDHKLVLMIRYNSRDCLLNTDEVTISHCVLCVVMPTVLSSTNDKTLKISLLQ